MKNCEKTGWVPACAEMGSICAGANIKVKLILLFVLFFYIEGLSAAPLWEQPTFIKRNHSIDWTRRMAITNEGKMLFVWSDVSNGNRDIFVQCVDSNGNHLWPQPVAVDSKPKLQEYPAVTKTTMGDFVITWADFSTNQMGTVYAQKINPQGQRQWQAGGIAMCDFSGGAMDSQVIPDSNGGVFVIWSDNRNQNRDVYGQHLDANGNRLWQENGVPLAHNSTDEPEFIVKADSYGGFVLGYRQNISQYYVLRANRFNSDGVSTWTAPVILNGQISSGFALQMAFLNPDNLVFTWTNAITPESSDYVVQAKGVSMDGTVLWDTMEVSSENSANPYDVQMYPQITPGTNNTVIITWESGSSFYGLSSVYSQKLNALGEKLWNPQGVLVTDSLYSNNRETLVSDASGESYVFWQDSRNSETTGSNIYGQKLSTEGAPLWELGGRPIAVYPKEQSLPVAVIANNQLHLGWLDSRLGSNGIYCNVMNADGTWQIPASQQQVIWGRDGTYMYNQAVVLPRSSGAVVAWKDDMQTNSYDKLYFQLIEANGSILLEPNGRQVSTTENCQIGTLRVSVTPDDQVAIVWLEYMSDAYTIRTQLFDAQGNRMWGEEGIQVTTGIVSNNTGLGISYENGEFYYVWSSPVDVGVHHYDRIYGQKISNAARQWGDTGIMISHPTTNELFKCTEAQIIDRYFVWKRTSMDGSTMYRTNYWVKLLNPDGTAPEGWTADGKPFSNHWDTTTGQMKSSAVKTPSGLAICWIDSRDNVNRIYGQTVDPSGAMQWGDAGLYLAGQEVDNSPTKLNCQGTTLYLTWQEYSSEVNSYVVKVQSFNQYGFPLWETNGNVVADSDYSGYYTKTCAFANGGLLVCWPEYYSSIRYNDYYRYVNPDGTAQGPDTGYLIGNGDNATYSSELISAGNEAYVCWTESSRHWIHVAYYDDGNNDYMGLFLQKMSNETVALQDDEQPASQLILDQNYPNPFNPTTNISFYLKAQTEIELLIYNTKGQKVKTLHKGEMKNGRQSITWDGLDDSGHLVSTGIYLYRLSSGNASLTKKMILLR